MHRSLHDQRRPNRDHDQAQYERGDGAERGPRDRRIVIVVVLVVLGGTQPAALDDDQDRGDIEDECGDQHAALRPRDPAAECKEADQGGHAEHDQAVDAGATVEYERALAEQSQRHRADQVGQARADDVAHGERRMPAHEGERDDDQFFPLATGGEQAHDALRGAQASGQHADRAREPLRAPFQQDQPYDEGGHGQDHVHRVVPPNRRPSSLVARGL